MEKIDRKIIHNTVDEIISDTNFVKKIQTEDIDPLDGYIELGRNNLDNLEIGMHIKYIKKEFNLETGETSERVYNGGFLLDIKKGDKVFEMILVVKTNIIWNLRFIKYKIFGKKMKNFANKNDKIKDDFREMFGDLIAERKKELEQEQNEKIREIKSKKNKYKIAFGNENV